MSDLCNYDHSALTELISLTYVPSNLGTSMLDLVEMLFARYGIQSMRYDGSMDRAAREAVLTRFRQPGGPRVILIRCVNVPSRRQVSH